MPKSKLVRILDVRLWCGLKSFGFRTSLKSERFCLDFGRSNNRPNHSLNVRFLDVSAKLGHYIYIYIYINFYDQFQLKWSSLVLKNSNRMSEIRTSGNRTRFCSDFSIIRISDVHISAFHCIIMIFVYLYPLPANSSPCWPPMVKDLSTFEFYHIWLYFSS